MIKRTVEISREPAHLATQHKQFLIKRNNAVVGSVPCEDLGMVVVDHPGTTYSHAALTALADSDAVLVICGRNHLPAAVMLPLADHSQVVWRINDQIAVKKPVQKKLWKQVVQAKIRAQAGNLPEESAAHKKLRAYAAEVRSGDTTNREAQAARVYWAHWLLHPDRNVSDEVFRRQREGVSPNSLLNYGYAILRAAVARALVSSGLMPSLGIQHSHRSNAFCLADDLMEPLRPMVDARVRELYWEGRTELDQETKASLLELLAAEVVTNGKSGPLMVALHTLTSSLARCYEGVCQKLEIPTPCKSADIVACG